MQIEIELRDRYFLVRITGVVRDGGLQQYAEAVVGAMREHGLRRVLLDERGVTHESDMLEAYLAGESEAIAGAAMEGYRVACIPSGAHRRKNETFQTLMCNRSVNYRLFDDEVGAEAWLLS